jgi:hypothetical protein
MTGAGGQGLYLHTGSEPCSHSPSSFSASETSDALLLVYLLIDLGAAQPGLKHEPIIHIPSLLQKPGTPRKAIDRRGHAFRNQIVVSCHC